MRPLDLLLYRPIHFPWLPSAANSKSLRMSYPPDSTPVGGVLTFEPYRSTLYPLLHIQNLVAATASSKALRDRFLDYDERNDFVGMDMARKFIHLGKIRAMKNSEFEGGRMVDEARVKSEKVEGDYEWKEEKINIWKVFERQWRVLMRHPGYVRKMKAFVREKEIWVAENGITGPMATRFRMPNSRAGPVIEGSRRGPASKPRGRMRASSPRLHQQIADNSRKLGREAG